jgi:hypothetical protein
MLISTKRVAVDSIRDNEFKLRNGRAGKVCGECNLCSKNINLSRPQEIHLHLMTLQLPSCFEINSFI